MKKVNYTIIVPNDADIDSVVIKIKYNYKQDKGNGWRKNIKHGTFVQRKRVDGEDPDEGFLFDELY